MDVIAQALFFGFRVTWWLGVQSFYVSCHATKTIFEGILWHLLGGMLMSGPLMVTLTSAILWGGIWAIVMGLFNGTEGAASGAVIGVVWGIFCAAQTMKAWDLEDMMHPPNEQEEQMRMLDKPLSIEEDSNPFSPVDDLLDGTPDKGTEQDDDDDDNRDPEPEIVR